MSWSRFVAYAVFVVIGFVWTQWRRGRGRLGTVIGMVAFVAVLWIVLRLTGN